MAVRRRSSDLVKSRVVDLPSIQEDEVTERHSTLLEDGRRLFDKAAKSEYKETRALIEGLASFVDAASIGSRDAVDEMKKFLVTTSQKRLAFVLNDLPKDLLSTAKVLVEGSETEKQVYRVARDMFRTMAGGKKEIKKEDVDEAAMKLLAAEAVVVGPEEVKSVSSLKGSVKRLLKFGLKMNNYGDETVTEQAFCLVACQYARGELVLPLEADDYRLSPERYQEFLKSNWIKKVMEFPKQTAHYLGQYSLKTVEKHGVRWIWSYLPIKQLYLLVFVYVVPMISLSFLLSIFATLVFFCSFLTMVITTVQIVANWRRVNWFMEYSTIFRYFSKHGSAIDTKGPENKLLKKTGAPYITFCIGTILTMLTISLAYQVVIVYELLFILSTVLSVFVFIRFKCWESPLIIGSIFVRLLGWSMVLLSLLEELVPIPGFMFLFGKQIFSVSVFSGIALEVNLITLIQVPLQTALLLFLSLRYSLKDLLLVVGNYLLFMSWWMFSKHVFTHCSLLYLGLFLPAVFLLFFLTPLLPIAFISAPFVCFIYFGGLSIEFLVCISAVVVLGIGCLIVILNYSRLKEAKWLNIQLEYLFLMQLVLCIPVMYIGAWYYTGINSPSHLPAVTIEQYGEYCSGITGNTIQSQIDCLHLEGRLLTGKAQVDSVVISAVQNSRLDMVNRFPKPINVAMACLMGEKHPMCGDNYNSPTCLFKGCHFGFSNRYTVTIKASVAIDRNNSEQQQFSMKLVTNILHKHMLNSSLKLLKKDMPFNFNATILSGMGTDEGLALSLKDIVFVTDHSSQTYSSSRDLLDFDKGRHEVFSLVLQSIKYDVGFILEILLGYTLPTS